MDDTRKVTSIVTALNERDAQPMAPVNPVRTLKTAIFDSFVKRLNIILEEESFKAVVEKALLDKIESNEVSVSQLISILNSTKQSSTIALDSLFSLLKPVPNAVNPLMDSMTNKQDSEGMIQAFDSLSGQESENLGKLMRLLTMMDSTKEG